MATVAVEQMRPRLLTIEEATQRLQQTEPLGVIPFSSAEKIAFRFSSGWETSLEATPPTEAVDAFVTVDGDEHQLTREGVEQVAGLVNISKKNLKTLPANITEQAMNYFYDNMGEQAYNMLTVKGLGSAFTNRSVVPFSTLQLFEQAIEGIHSKYAGAEILVDYKFQNTLSETNINLIVPANERFITGGAMGDIPAGERDVWSAGIHLTNSLSAKSPTVIESYLFRWWCTNGAIESLGSVGTWNRRSNGQTEGVYSWAKDSVKEVLDGMETRFSKIQRLTEIEMQGANTGEVLRQIFNEYKVPLAQRESVQNTLLDADAITMYTVMNAITQSANNVDAARAHSLMRIGGNIPNSVYDSDRARVWKEGNSSGPGSKNPYEIRMD